MRRRGFLTGAAAVPWVLTAPGASAQDGTTGTFTALSGDRFVRGDTEYRLADILAPPLYTLGETRPVYFNPSRTALQGLLNGGGAIVTEAAAPSRWDVKAVRAASRSGYDFAEALIGAGAARVAPQTDDLVRIDRLLALEGEARRARRGLWAYDAYRVRRANDLDDAAGVVGGFCLLEGTVRHAAAARARVYLNFGDDYRTDFTASAANRLARRWRKAGFEAGLDLAALEGRRLRLRGVVAAINGPSIDLKHPRQIEIIDGDAAVDP